MCWSTLVWDTTGSIALPAASAADIDAAGETLCLNSAHPIAVASTGEIYVAVGKADPAVYRSTDGGITFSRFLSLSTTGTEVINPTVCVQGDLLVVVWASGAGTVPGASIEGIRFDATGALDTGPWTVSDDTRLSSGFLTDAFSAEPCACFDEDGHVVVAYMRRPEGDPAVRLDVVVARSRVAAADAAFTRGGWDRVTVSQRIAGETDDRDARHPSVAAANGRIGVAYKYENLDGTTDVKDIYVAMLDVSSGAPVPVDVTRGTSGPVAEVFIAGGGAPGITGYAAGATYTSTRAHDPCLCASEGGRFLVVFHAPSAADPQLREIGYAESWDGSDWLPPSPIPGQAHSQDFVQFANVSAAPAGQLSAVVVWEEAYTNNKKTPLQPAPMIHSAVTCPSDVPLGITTVPDEVYDRPLGTIPPDTATYRTFPNVFVDDRFRVHCIAAGRDPGDPGFGLFYRGGTLV